MKIQTIEQSIAAIENAGYFVKESKSEKYILHNNIICSEIYNDSEVDIWLVYEIVSPVMTALGYTVDKKCIDFMNKDELIEFGKYCQLKAFW